MTTTENILLEFEIGLGRAFKKIVPIYSYIQRDKNIPSIEDKLTIINTIEKYRLGNRSNLPAYYVNPKNLIATQDYVDSGRTVGVKSMDEKTGEEPFVVGLNGLLFLMDGHHRIYNAIKGGAEKVKVRALKIKNPDLFN